MTDLVTGATGLLGGNLVRTLLADGRAVRVLVRERSDTRALEGLDVERAPGDITDPASLRASLEGVERVFHCAALVSMWSRRAAAMREVNVEGTRNVLVACADAGVRRLVHCSSVDGIGLPEGDAPADEETPWNWDRLGVDNPYARTKLESQRLVVEAAREGRVDAVVVNPSYMFGAYDVRPSSGQMILEVAAGKALGATAGGNNFVDVLDVTRGMLAAAERGRRGELYILGHENLTYRQAFTLIAEVLGVAPPRFAIPAPLARVGGWLGDLGGALSGREPAINSLTARLGYVRHYYSPAKAVRELDLPQTPVREAIARAAAWFRAAGMLAP